MPALPSRGRTYSTVDPFGDMQSENRDAMHWEWLVESGSGVKFTRYEGAGHVEAWEKAYDDPKVWKWLFEQHRPAEKETE